MGSFSASTVKLPNSNTSLYIHHRLVKASSIQPAPPQLQNVYYAGSHGLDIMAPLESFSSWNRRADLALDQKDFETLQQKAVSVLQKYSDFHLTWGKMVMEIRPSIEWNKGHALKYLLETLGFKDSSDVLPLYLGDDRTAEDAFKDTPFRQLYKRYATMKRRKAEDVLPSMSARNRNSD